MAEGGEAVHWVDDPEKLWGYASQLQSDHRPRIANDEALLRNCNPYPLPQDGVAGGNTTTTDPLEAYDNLRSLNPGLTGSVVDSALPQICKPISVRILPVGADPQTFRACEDLTRLTEGVFDTNRFFETSQNVVLDGMRTTLGAVKVFVHPVTKDVCIERVNPLTLFWDFSEQDRPYTLVQVHGVPKRRLMAEYPDHAAFIRGLPSYTEATIPGVEPYGTRGRSDNAQVVEAWAPQVGKTPGLHAIAIGSERHGSKVLDKNVYTDKVHPIIPYRWAPSFRNWGGIPLAQTIAPLDTYRQRLIRLRYESLLGCIPVIWEHTGESAFEGITDLPYQRGRYNGAKPPEITVAGKVSTDIAAEIQALEVEAYSRAGISQQVSSGNRPVGLNSDPAIQAWLETTALRLLSNQQRYEQFVRDVAMVVVLTSRTAYASKATRVRAANTHFISEIKFPDLKENSFEVTASIASGLSQTVSGRIQQVDNLSKLGVIQPKDVARHLNIPDLQAAQDEAQAPRMLAEKMVYDALYDATWPKAGPTRLQDLGELVRVGKAQYQLALERGSFKDENLQCLQRLVRTAETLMQATAPLNQAAAPPAAPMPAPGPTPGTEPPPMTDVPLEVAA